MIAGEKLTISLPAGKQLSIVASGTMAGSVTRLSDSVGGQPFSPVAIAGANLTFGPYGSPRRYELDCTVGGILFSVASVDPADEVDLTALNNAIAAQAAVMASLYLSGAGAPTDGTTGATVALPGATYIDTTGGFVYRNSGSQAVPAWTKLADAIA